MEYIILILKGMIIGVANIIPGVSGGTLMITLGLYEEVIEYISQDSCIQRSGRCGRGNIRGIAYRVFSEDIFASRLSSTIIIISSEFLWIKDGKKTFFLSFFAFFFDISLGFVYHYSEGLFSYYDSIQSVIMFDYGLFAFMTFSIMMIFYPLYWISKKCIEFFSD